MNMAQLYRMPGSRMADFREKATPRRKRHGKNPIQLRSGPSSSFDLPHRILLPGADVILTALRRLCLEAFTRFPEGKSIAIACPNWMKEDVYQEKIKSLDRRRQDQHPDLLIMQVPCCMGS